MKTILVTGATSGIGLEASVVFAREGNLVVMVGRDAKKTEAAVATVKQRSGGQSVEWLLCDFTSLASVRKLAADYRAKYDRLDVLVNNAGTVYAARTLTGDGIEGTFEVNHLGPFLLTELLEDLLVKSSPARVVNVSSTGHYRGTMNFDDLGFERGGYSIMQAYSRSKLGNVMFTRSLAKKLADKGVTVNALHPGAVATNIWSKAPGWAQPILSLAKSLFMISPEKGGQTITYLATSPEVANTSGKYFEKNREKTPSALARDDAACERLWAESSKLVGLV